MATPEVLDEFFKASSEYARNNREKISRIWLAQRETELNIISEKDNLCPLSQVNNFELRAEDIQKTFRERFGDGNALKALMCINNTLAIYPASAGLTRNYKVRHYIRRLRQVGAESIAGYAMASTIIARDNQTNTDEPFVTKAPRVLDESTNYEQIHEYFVGAYGTNNLRDKIPNFAYVMGMFKCSPPYIDAKRQVLTFCQNEDPSKQAVYLLYENIKNAVTLHDYIKNGCTLAEFLNIWIQILFALDLAYREFRYTHEDLHDRNVLVEELPEEIFIPYTVSTTGEVRLLKTRFIARIIDLGRSLIFYNNQPFGYALYEGGVYPETPYPIYDVYKLLLNCLVSAAVGDRYDNAFVGKLDSEAPLTNPGVFNGIKGFLDFFNPQIIRGRNGAYEGVVDYLLNTRRFYYSLAYSKDWDIRPLEFYEDVVRPKVDTEFLFGVTEDPNRIYGCASRGICLTLQQAVGEYAELDLNLLDDPYVFYEVLHDAVDKDPAEARSLLSSGASRFKEYMEKLRREAKEYFDEYNRIIQGLSIHSLFSPGREDLVFRDPYLEQYLNYLSSVVRAYDLKTSLLGAITIMNFLIDQYSYLSKGAKGIQGPIETYRTESPLLSEAYESIQMDIDYLSTLDKEFLLRVNPKINILLNRLTSFRNAISPV